MIIPRESPRAALKSNYISSGEDDFLEGVIYRKLRRCYMAGLLHQSQQAGLPGDAGRGEDRDRKFSQSHHYHDRKVRMN
jgi:hypothetical protein